MSGQFKVGEVLVGQNLLLSSHRNGCECMVIEGLSLRDGYSLETGKYSPPDPGYIVRWLDGMRMHVHPSNLRRKKPPTGEQSVLDMFKLPSPSKEIA